MEQPVARKEEWALLQKEFYARDTVKVAKELLGKYMVSFSEQGITVGKVVETEAYLGKTDPACHSARGKTSKNEVMFGPAGRAYVYIIYGIHYCFNVTTGDLNTPAAVLIRALEPIEGIEIMERRRGCKKITELCSGPGKLTTAMGISMNENGKSLVSGPVRFFTKNQEKKESRLIVTTTRIGISKAADLPLRFYLKQNPYISRP